MSWCKVRLAFAATLGFNLVAGLVALRWVRPLFPGDPVQFIFGFILAALGYTAGLEIMLRIAKEGPAG